METKRELLRLFDLPVFETEHELASLMHVASTVITDFIYRSKYFYKQYRIKKSSGKYRLIKQPSRELKGVQAWILRNIVGKIPLSDYATGYIRGKNILHNVSQHRGNTYFLCIDLEDFFPSISSNRVMKKFQIVGYSTRTAWLLTRLCTFKGTLPQGAVTSPALSNWVASQLDRRIGGYAAKANMVYTRYSDDITLSSNNWGVLRKSLSRITKIIKREHFIPNLSKLRFMEPGRRCIVTGLVKHDTDQSFGIGYRKKRVMRAILHNYICKTRVDTKYKDDKSIYGWLEYLRIIEPKSYEKMNEYLNTLVEISIP